MYVKQGYTSHNKNLIPSLASLQARYAKRGRGFMDYAKKGLDLSKKFGIGEKLAMQDDSRLKMAGKLLQMAGGGRTRPTYRYRKLANGMTHAIHVPTGSFYSKKRGIRKYKK